MHVLASYLPRTVIMSGVGNDKAARLQLELQLFSVFFPLCSCHLCICISDASSTRPTPAQRGVPEGHHIAHPVSQGPPAEEVPRGLQRAQAGTERLPASGVRRAASEELRFSPEEEESFQEVVRRVKKRVLYLEPIRAQTASCRNI